MSGQGDSKRIVKLAEKQGCVVLYEKHGGYGLYWDGRLITRVPSNGHAGYHWVSRVRRDLSKVGVVV